MPRPFKSGVDYFPLDVIMDDEIELIESQHSIVGFAVLIKLYQKVYANNYWINWCKKTEIVFSKRINVNIIEVNAIINSCLEWEIFSQKMFDEFSILTSKGIQERFFEITKRRKRVEITKEYLLIDVPIDQNTEFVGVNADNNSVNANRSTQRKGKERKVKVPLKETSKKFDDDSTEMKICKYFYAVLLKSDPDLEEPNWQNWAKDVDLFLRKVKPTKEDIKKVIDWAHDPDNSNDKFSWIPNLRSPKKLRQHFKTILLQTKQRKNNGRVNAKDYLDNILKQGDSEEIILKGEDYGQI